MNSIQSNSIDSKWSRAQLDPRVQILVKSKADFSCFNAFDLEYREMEPELITPEMKFHNSKYVFSKQIVRTNQSFTGSLISKKSSKKKKKEKAADLLSEEYLKLCQDIFIEDPDNSKRRIRLSNLVKPNKKIKIFSLIKQFIGKDLTRCSIPVSLCEPISFLQRTAEILEYYSILSSAIHEESAYVRFSKIFGFFFVPLLCSTNNFKKPFNPLLGETFEYERFGVKYLSEQVSHHPPISAYHMESKDFIMWGHLELKSNLKGMSLDITPSGIVSDFFNI